MNFTTGASSTSVSALVCCSSSLTTSNSPSKLISLPKLTPLSCNNLAMQAINLFSSTIIIWIWLTANENFRLLKSMVGSDTAKTTLFPTFFNGKNLY